MSIICAWVPRGNAFDYVQNKYIDPRPLVGSVGLFSQHVQMAFSASSNSKGSGTPTQSTVVARRSEGCRSNLHNCTSSGLIHVQKNVLISEDGHALLADFGLLLLIENAFSLTAAAPIHPTVRWLSPEQITNDGKATTQSDVWAFGMTALVGLLILFRKITTNRVCRSYLPERRPITIFVILEASYWASPKDHPADQVRNLHVLE